MIKNNRGFTLVELLVCILIVSLIFAISLYSVTSIINNNQKDIDKITADTILDASKIYAMEYKDTEEWKKEESNNNKSFCISIESLINHGYLKDKNKYKDYIDKYVIDMDIVNGVYEYKLIEMDFSNPNSSNCRYFKEETIIKENNVLDSPLKEENKEIGSVDYAISKEEDNKYNLDLNLNINFELEKEEINNPVYVNIILDKSGSMRGTKFSSALNALTLLYNNIYDNIDNSHTLVMLYDNYNDILVNDSATRGKISVNDFNFISPSGGTETGEALKEIYTKITSYNNPNNQYYTVLLYDGIPFHENTLKEYSNKIIEYNNSKLIVIGYEMHNNNYKEYSSRDSKLCINSSLEGYCYYDSTSTNIANLFSNISNQIINQVKSIDADKIRLSLIPKKLDNNEDMFTIYKDGIVINNNIIYKEVDLTEYQESKKIIINNNYDLVLNNNLFRDCKDKECVYNKEMFDIEIELMYNDDTTKNKKITLNNGPKMTIQSHKIITVN